MTSQSAGLVFAERKIGEWDIPTIEFVRPSRSPLRVAVKGVIINSIVDGARGRERQQNWKAQVASEVKSKRGTQPWNAGDEYAITLVMRFHMGNHGNVKKLDAENFAKPTIDAIAAGLFCSNSTEPRNISSWCYDDSNFNTLLIHRLPDAQARTGEAIAVSISARSAR